MQQSHICTDMKEQGFSVISMGAWMKETDLKVYSTAFFKDCLQGTFLTFFFSLSICISEFLTFMFNTSFLKGSTITF